MALKTTRWDIADYLKTKEDVAGYLDAVLEDGDPELLKDVPAGAIAVPWIYEARTNYSRFVEPLAALNIPTIVAPGIWNCVKRSFFCKQKAGPMKRKGFLHA